MISLVTLYQSLASDLLDVPVTSKLGQGHLKLVQTGRSQYRLSLCKVWNVWMKRHQGGWGGGAGWRGGGGYATEVSTTEL